MLEPAVKPLPSKQRTKVANGRALPSSGDGRSRWGRRFAEIVAAHSEALGGTLSEAQRGLVASAAGVQVQVEELNARLSRGEVVDADALVRLNTVLTRTLRSLGLAGRSAARDEEEDDTDPARHFARPAA